MTTKHWHPLPLLDLAWAWHWPSLGRGAVLGGVALLLSALSVWLLAWAGSPASPLLLSGLFLLALVQGHKPWQLSLLACLVQQRSPRKRPSQPWVFGVGLLALLLEVAWLLLTAFALVALLLHSTPALVHGGFVTHPALGLKVLVALALYLSYYSLVCYWLAPSLSLKPLDSSAVWAATAGLDATNEPSPPLQRIGEAPRES